MQNEILEFIYQAWPKPKGPTEAAKALGISYPTALVQFKRLKSKGEITRKGKGFVLTYLARNRLMAAEDLTGTETWFSAPVAAAILRIPAQQVTRLIRDGEIKAKRIEGSKRTIYRIHRKEIERLRSQSSSYGTLRTFRRKRV